MKLIIGLLLAGVAFGQLAPKITAVASAAGPYDYLALNSYISIYGTGLSIGVSQSSPPYTSNLNGTEVLYCGLPNFSRDVSLDLSKCQPIAISYSSPTQINAILSGLSTPNPYSFLAVRVNSVVDQDTANKNPTSFVLYPSAPSIFLAGNDCATDLVLPLALVDCSLRPGLGDLRTRMVRGAITDLNGSLVWSANAGAGRKILRAMAGGNWALTVNHNNNTFNSSADLRLSQSYRTGLQTALRGAVIGLSRTVPNQFSNASIQWKPPAVWSVALRKLLLGVGLFRHYRKFLRWLLLCQSPNQNS
jgi:hypothetical protein